MLKPEPGCGLPSSWHMQTSKKYVGSQASPHYFGMPIFPAACIVRDDPFLNSRTLQISRELSAALALAATVSNLSCYMSRGQKRIMHTKLKSKESCSKCCTGNHWDWKCKHACRQTPTQGLREHGNHLRRKRQVLQRGPSLLQWQQGVLGFGFGFPPLCSPLCSPFKRLIVRVCLAYSIYIYIYLYLYIYIYLSILYLYMI